MKSDVFASEYKEYRGTCIYIYIYYTGIYKTIARVNKAVFH